MGLEIELREPEVRIDHSCQTFYREGNEQDSIKATKERLMALTDVTRILSMEQYTPMIPEFKASVEKIMGYIERSCMGSRLQRADDEVGAVTLEKEFIEAMDAYMALLFARRYEVPIRLGSRITPEIDDDETEVLSDRRMYITDSYRGFSDRYESGSWRWYNALAQEALPALKELVELSEEDTVDQDNTRLTPDKYSPFIPKVGKQLRNIMDRVEKEEEGIITTLFEDFESSPLSPFLMTLEGAFVGALRVYTTLLSAQEYRCDLILHD